MSRPLIRLDRVVAIAFLSLMLTWAMPRQSFADLVVAPGWDLYQNTTATIFGVPFVGVPIGTFTFGVAGEPVGGSVVGNTDTIIRRIGTATPANPTVAMEMIALQLQSSAPFDPDGGGPLPTNTYAITLGTGTQPQGTNTISFTNDSGGNYSYSVPADVVLRETSVTGSVVGSGSFNLSSSGTWGRIRPLVPPGSVTSGPTVDNVNFTLKADNTTDQDFWAGAAPSLQAVPEPSLAMTSCLSIVGMALMAVKRRFSRRKKEEGELAVSV